MNSNASEPNNRPASPPNDWRFLVVIGAVLLVCVAIMGKALLIIGPQRSAWLRKIDDLKIENRIIEPQRGNIYAADGSLMASSIPEYQVYMDFKADGLVYDSLMNNIDALSRALERKFGERSAAGWRTHILRGYNSGSRNYRLINRRISYTERKELKQMPFLRQPAYKSGLKMTEMARRQKPYGQLASRTIGDVYGDMAMGGRNGLELAYDSLLRGVPGVGTRRKVAGVYMTIPNEGQNAIDGADITTTIDINIQDITHTALLEKLREIDAESGTAVVMEVKTGEIKAISNLGRTSTGHYAETKNFAVSDQSEPGSTFKVASMIVALDKGITTPYDTVDVGNGIYYYKGVRMTDHNNHKGGYGRISAAQAIWYSSNIGVAKIILKGFENKPSEYVESLYAMGLNERFDFNIPGAGAPRIRHPKDSTRYWSKTTLPWMSFGYETQIPPIYTLTFFNAIANDGCMVKPYFVKSITKDGHTIKKFSTEVVRDRICKKQTLHEIRQMLVDVVEHGTAVDARSSRIKLAGKTGTAQISKGALGYQAGGKTHQVSFCGYFPADDPIYSCIVVVRSPRNAPPSGGKMSGMVFKHIAERTFAQMQTARVERDSSRTFLPQVKSGNYEAATCVIDELDLECDDLNRSWEWATARTDSGSIMLQERSFTDTSVMPQVVGMGAKDAVFLVERTGARVVVNGRGRVVQQSKTAGQKIKKGETITITLK